MNFQEEGQELHYGQILDVPRHHSVWNQLKKSCEFEKRLAEVEAFNKQHRWKKRGVSMIPTKFGISFTTKFLNQVIMLACPRPIILNEFSMFRWFNHKSETVRA